MCLCEEIYMKIAVLSSHPQDEARIALIEAYGQTRIEDADLIVCLGGDGFMLKSMHKYHHLGIPFYGMNRGTVGFLMNDYQPDGLQERLKAAEPVEIHPLKMTAQTVAGETVEHLAFNEVSLLRSGPQAARLKVMVNDRTRLPELVCDGAMVSTPAGSTAYNYSAHGPILPITANILALTAVAPYRPRRWRGALLPMDVKVRFEIEQAEKRPVHAYADSFPTDDVISVEVMVENAFKIKLLFDPGHGLEERLLQEQFE